MSLTKKDYQELANLIADQFPYTGYEEENKRREEFIQGILPFCRSQNSLFDETRFREWINRRLNGESTKGLG